ncbi:ATP-dependent Clp protease ATP-binding subunit, partial [Candidatus Sumerlaeota bacterium]|nr:ATP-dependent Clp protease ATP-binding subunit [Candidatus Sumerlaeota bacterium]
ILVIDELHTIVGAGAAEGAVDAANMLKPALARGELQCIGATTMDEYRKYIEKDAALARRFQTILVEAPSVEETVAIIMGLRDKYEVHHRVKFSDEAVVAAAKLSNQYIMDRFLPDKAVDVIDEAGSRARLKITTRPAELKEIEREIEAVTMEKESSIRSQEYEKAASLRDKERTFIAKLDERKREWEKQRDSAETTVTEEDIAYVVSKWTGVPLTKLEEKESERLLRMRDELHKQVIGQDDAIDAITRAIQRSRAGLKSSKRPVEFELVRAYTLTNRPEEAMTVLRALEDDGGDAQSELRIAELKGMILQSLGRDQDAWEAYQRATEIDPLWWRRDAGRAESYARAADKTGEMAQAERAYFFAVHSFEEKVWTMPGMFLSYADLLRRLGDGARRRGMTDEALAFDRDARHWYRRILGLLGEESSESALRSEAQRRLREYYGAEIASGKASLGLFHMSRGEVIQAMAQLQGAYEENVLSGAGSAPVREAVNEIVEPYMSWAVRQGLWHEVIGAWELFGRELQESHARNAALSYLATSLSSVGLDARSLLIIEDLLQKEEGSGIPTKDLLRVRRAEILSRLGRGEEVIEPLKELSERDSITNVRTDALRVLAGVYADMGRNLEAAQALEELASGSDLAADERGNVWARAGNIYLEESMTDHAIEIGLRALILEDEHQGNSSSPLWDVAVGNRLRLMLGRAFYEQGDFERASITLRDYLNRDGLHPGEKGMGGYLLSASQRLRGEVADARTTLENAQSDFSIPEIWRKASAEALATLQWEEARKN